MDIERNPYKSQHNIGQASRPGDPASFFRNQQEDLFLHDPDVWAPLPAKDTKTNGNRIGTANRKLDGNKRGLNAKSASTAAVAPIKRNGTKPLSRAGTAKAGTSKNGKENGDSNKNGGNGEKSDKSEKDDENEEEKTPERKFEAASHADIDLVDMLGEWIYI